ncbi:MAG: hypothetical protein ACOC15_03520 [Desulfovibrionales bacterium]
MSRTHNRTQRIWSPAQRGVLGLLCLVLALLLLAGAGWIAFAYESSSMLYKFGWDKRLLRAGKVVGLAAATLVLLQLVLSARLRFLDRAPAPGSGRCSRGRAAPGPGLPA